MCRTIKYLGSGYTFELFSFLKEPAVLTQSNNENELATLLSPTPCPPALWNCLEGKGIYRNGIMAGPSSKRVLL